MSREQVERQAALQRPPYERAGRLNWGQITIFCKLSAAPAGSGKARENLCTDPNLAGLLGTAFSFDAPPVAANPHRADVEAVTPMQAPRRRSSYRADAPLRGTAHKSSGRQGACIGAEWIEVAGFATVSILSTDDNWREVIKKIKYLLSHLVPTFTTGTVLSLTVVRSALTRSALCSTLVSSLQRRSLYATPTSCSHGSFACGLPNNAVTRIKQGRSKINHTELGRCLQQL